MTNTVEPLYVIMQPFLVRIILNPTKGVNQMSCGSGWTVFRSVPDQLRPWIQPCCGAAQLANKGVVGGYVPDCIA